MSYFSTALSIAQLLAVLGGLYVALTGLSAWRLQKLIGRRIEISEEILRRFAEMRDIILSVTHPAMWESEKDQIKEQFPEGDFNDREKDVLAQYAAPLFRFKNHEDKIKDFMQQKYLCQAYFGIGASDLFESLWRVIVEIQISSQTLVSRGKDNMRSGTPLSETQIENRERHIGMIWMTKDDGSEFTTRFERIFTDATRLFGFYLKEPKRLISWI